MKGKTCWTIWSTNSTCWSALGLDGVVGEQGIYIPVGKGPLIILVPGV
jgi:hypothetical protein